MSPRTIADWCNVVILAAICNLAVAVASPATLRADPRPLSIVAFGDSLTAGYSLPAEAMFPRQLERALQQKGYAISMADAGVSGDTTAAGLERLDWSIPEGTDAVILQLGANDALRGLEPGQSRQNLGKIIERLQGRGIEVLLAGMHAPRNMGETYIAAFDPIYAYLAERYGLLYYPFFLEGVAMRPELNLDDGMHPNASGIKIIVDRILPKVEELIGRVASRRAAGAKL
ncbi:MAG: arylesterase [Hyphomicrobium sp.]